MSTVYVVGIGPGAEEQMTVRAQKVLEHCPVLIGYNVYIDLVKEQFPDKIFLSTPMRKEPERCRMAFEEAEKGNIKLGGCEVFIGGGQPDRFCKDCEHEWCVDDFLVEDILKISFRLSVLMLSILHLKNR